MKLKKIKILKETETHIFFNITTVSNNLFFNREIKDKRKCFYNKNKKESRFFDTGALIESDINHSINAVLNDL